MSSQVVTYVVGAGSAVSFEIDPVPGFVPAASAGEVIGRVKAAIGPAVEAAQEGLEHVRDAGPDRVAVKFGVKVTGTMNCWWRRRRRKATSR